MTKSEAKELSLEVWGYLRDHPEIKTKISLPPELYVKIARLKSHCPLCEIFGKSCYLCPLNHCDLDSPYDIWGSAKENFTRKAAATKIVKLIEDWEV